MRRCTLLLLLGGVLGWKTVIVHAKMNGPYPSPITDATILNFALAFEQLSNAFYDNGLAKYDAQSFNTSGFAPGVRNRYLQIAAHKRAHVQSLVEALSGSGNATLPCEYNFPHNDTQTFTSLSQIMEGVGTSAYISLIAQLTSYSYRLLISRILSTRARHASWIAASVNSFTPWGGPFDVPLDMDSTYTFMSKFIVSCPSTNPQMPVSIFPAVVIGAGRPGTTVSIQFNDTQTSSTALEATGARPSSTSPSASPSTSVMSSTPSSMGATGTLTALAGVGGATVTTPPLSAVGASIGNSSRESLRRRWSLGSRWEIVASGSGQGSESASKPTSGTMASFAPLAPLSNESSTPLSPFSPIATGSVNSNPSPQLPVPTPIPLNLTSISSHAPSPGPGPTSAALSIPSVSLQSVPGPPPSSSSSSDFGTITSGSGPFAFPHTSPFSTSTVGSGVGASTSISVQVGAPGPSSDGTTSSLYTNEVSTSSNAIPSIRASGLQTVPTLSETLLASIASNSATSTSLRFIFSPFYSDLISTSSSSTSLLSPSESFPTSAPRSTESSPLAPSNATTALEPTAPLSEIPSLAPPVSSDPSMFSGMVHNPRQASPASPTSLSPSSSLSTFPIPLSNPPPSSFSTSTPPDPTARLPEYQALFMQASRLDPTPVPIVNSAVALPRDLQGQIYVLVVRGQFSIPGVGASVSPGFSSTPGSSVLSSTPTSVPTPAPSSTPIDAILAGQEVPVGEIIAGPAIVAFDGNVEIMVTF